MYQSPAKQRWKAAMHVVILDHPADFDGWRKAARGLVAAGVGAAEITWQVSNAEQRDLLAVSSLAAPTDGAAFTVPRRFIELAEAVICHRDSARFGLLYQALLRLRDAPKLLEDRTDPLVDRLEAMERAVGRDIHKMRAFVRFREVAEGPPPSPTGPESGPGAPPAGRRFVAWFEPEHHIVRRNAGFFARRFANMRWSILTPDLCVHWDGEELDFTPGATRAEAPGGDELEATWRTYYAAIFNPARLKVRAMHKEMPKKYWRNLPETSLVPSLVASAGARTAAMIERGPSEKAKPMARDDRSDDAPVYKSLAEARGASDACTRCHLFQNATQTVFGEGPEKARLMFIGEQPGDQEDLSGRPFVGPAGRVFDRALAEAGIDRAETYVTNAVKHFKFVPRGARRIHQKPDAGEIEACRFWLDHERAFVKPRLTVALGATAARALLGKVVTISKTRGAPIELADGSEGWVTIHPSFLLRIEDQDAADIEYRRFVADLARIKERLAELAA